MVPVSEKAEMVGKCLEGKSEVSLVPDADFAGSARSCYCTLHVMKMYSISKLETARLCNFLCT